MTRPASGPGEAKVVDEHARNRAEAEEREAEWRRRARERAAELWPGLPLPRR